MQKIVLGIVLFLLIVTLYALFDIITPKAPEKEPVLRAMPQAGPSVAPQPAAGPLSIEEKKRRFIAKLLPAVKKVKKTLDREYEKALSLSKKAHLDTKERRWLQEKLDTYNVKGIPCLLRRMHTHPVSLVIAQAALETGWGKSRFFKEANNVFGIWSYHKNEPRIPASKTRGDKTIYVRKFASLEEAIFEYYKMIAGGYAYADFRKARMKTDNPFKLLRHLRHYSELRDEYVARLYYVIRANKLYSYDDPSYPPVALARILPQYVAQKRKAAAAGKARETEIALNEIRIPEPPSANAADCEENTTGADSLTLQAPESSTAAPERSALP